MQVVEKIDVMNMILDRIRDAKTRIKKLRKDRKNWYTYSDVTWKIEQLQDYIIELNEGLTALQYSDTKSVYLLSEDEYEIHDYDSKFWHIDYGLQNHLGLEKVIETEEDEEKGEYTWVVYLNTVNRILALAS